MVQDLWMWCNKCQGLAFAGGNGIGACAAGGVHDHYGSGNYELWDNIGSNAAPGANLQDQWKWCNKCQALNFSGRGSMGACAAGGIHDDSGSGDYSLATGTFANAQENWEFCAKCQMLVFTSYGLGPCPSGGTHYVEGSGTYYLTGAPDEPASPIVWSFPAVQAGNVTMNGATLTVNPNGAWSWNFSVHDSSTWTGDNWAYAFVFVGLGHGAFSSGTLGAKYSGPAVDASIALSGTDPWLAGNIHTLGLTKITATLHQDDDLGQLLSGVANDLGKIIGLVDGGDDSDDGGSDDSDEILKRPVQVPKPAPSVKIPFRTRSRQYAAATSTEPPMARGILPLPGQG